ncbi:hypothetical protein VNO78_26937 [Psophocarpus tetragonolobus]|uniref:Uncharacterized protein n=1 Tax=Psophocarpus tetragonolobus TaxID=3891 RepID=A0AAN9RZY3_PSOTE
MMDKPKISNMENVHKEKQIVVNAVSQEESCDVNTTLSTSQPPKPKFPSLSLPNSANSSPSTLMKKLKHRSKGSPCQASTLKHHYWLQAMHLRRSKSCGEGRVSRSPSEEFDLWWVKPSAVEHDNMNHSSFSKTEATTESLVSGKNVETHEDEEGFKCSALCLYLPGFGKAKAVKTKEGSEIEGGVNAISRTVSLEKFECGSWASSSLFNEIEGDRMNSSYFDLPLELIKCSDNDVHAPITSAFVFEKELKRIPKTGSSVKSHHHVGFSTSSSTSKPASPASCITPRLRKAREDFTTFLEAQSA